MIGSNFRPVHLSGADINPWPRSTACFCASPVAQSHSFPSSQLPPPRSPHSSWTVVPLQRLMLRAPSLPPSRAPDTYHYSVYHKCGFTSLCLIQVLIASEFFDTALSPWCLAFILSFILPKSCSMCYLYGILILTPQPRELMCIRDLGNCNHLFIPRTYFSAACPSRSPRLQSSSLSRASVSYFSQDWYRMVMDM